MILNSSSDSIELVLSSAKTANDCPFTVSYIDGPIATYTPTPAYGNTNGTSAVPLLSGPSSNQRRIQEITVFNADTAAVTLTVRFNNNGTAYILQKPTLQVGETLMYVTGTGFRVLDPNGAVRTLSQRSTNDRMRSIGFVIDGGATVLTTGTKGNIRIPYTGRIQKATLLSKNGATGAIVVDVKKSTYAAFGTSSSICASAKPTISATGAKSEDSTLTGWTVAVTAGDILYANIDSVTSFTGITLLLDILTD